MKMRCLHYAVTEFFDCMEEEFSNALSVIESSDEDVFEDAVEMVSNFVEVEEVTEEDLPNNQQAKVNHVHEDNDDDEKLHYFDAMDEELESPGKANVFNLNLDAFRKTKTVKGRTECFTKREDVKTFMEEIDHSELVRQQ